MYVNQQTNINHLIRQGWYLAWLFITILTPVSKKNIMILPKWKAGVVICYVKPLSTSLKWVCIITAHTMGPSALVWAQTPWRKRSESKRSNRASLPYPTQNYGLPHAHSRDTWTALSNLWFRFFVEQFIVTLWLNKFPVVYWTWVFIIEIRKAHNWAVTWARWWTENKTKRHTILLCRRRETVL
jgi:hypothetical protein